jgi:hypothetical protein
MVNSWSLGAFKVLASVLLCVFYLVLCFGLVFEKVSPKVAQADLEPQGSICPFASVYQVAGCTSGHHCTWLILYFCLCSLICHYSKNPAGWGVQLSLSLFFIIHLFTCAYIVSFLPPASLPPPSPFSPLPPGRTCSALISNFVEEKTQA